MAMSETQNNDSFDNSNPFQHPVSSSSTTSYEGTELNFTLRSDEGNFCSLQNYGKYHQVVFLLSLKDSLK